MMNSVSDKIMERIQLEGQRWVFIPSDFFDLGSQSAVHSALRRLSKKGNIRHFSRGLYDFPRYSQLWNEFGVPDQEGIVEAVARQAKCAILPSGATAANQLGLSEQVPAKLEYVWSKNTKKLQVGNRTFIFYHASQIWVDNCGYSIAGLILQALDWFGVNNVDDSMVKYLARFSSKLSQKDKKLLKINAPNWV
ncbi:MAG: DUF6088 family protein, partial [Candidatus Parabeggiatoa sp.]|nr:DUF6088 family protein [Candidatus Parabeggiatoa sp.]